MQLCIATVITILVLVSAVVGSSFVGSRVGQLLASKTLRSLRTGGFLLKSHLKLGNTPPDTLNVAELDSIVIDCEAGGNPQPTIYWLKNGRRLSQDDDARWEENNGTPMLGLGYTHARLFIDCASSHYDEAEYTCVAENLYHRLSKSTKLTVTKSDAYRVCLVKKSFVNAGSPARITMWTHTRLELVGSTVQLFCRPTGTPKPNVIWFGPDDNEIQNGQKYKILENGDLEIRNIAWDDMGGYNCTAENAHGFDRTSTFLYPTLPA
ncbi:zwei Ig domain protein zig-2-like [Ornithodoros turicata]|uniref:zwei Ig domain protein zig-2-like n=1 Tax=Ornithodoros turicata TaxID=34597 RepID=UPI0031396884